MPERVCYGQVMSDKATNTLTFNPQSACIVAHTCNAATQ